MGLYDRDYGREQTPWDRAQAGPLSITVILIAINVVVFFADNIFYSLRTLSNGDLSKFHYINQWAAVSGNTLTQPWMWWQFLSYGFVHDILGRVPMHLLFNMLGLFVFGRDVENKLGRWEFLRFYLVAVVLGGLAGAVTNFATGGATIGASGAVVATVILFACYFPNRELLLMMVFPIKAWVLAVVFVMADLAGAIGVMTSMGTSRTAFTVHLAGAFFALGYFFRGWKLDWLGALGDLPNRMRQRSRRMKLKIHDPDRKLREEAIEADRILGKIHQSGESSLTASERKTLERYSRRQREKRDQ